MWLRKLILTCLYSSLLAPHFTFGIEFRVLLCNQVQVVTWYELVYAGSIIAWWIEVSHGAVVVAAPFAHLPNLVLLVGHHGVIVRIKQYELTILLNLQVLCQLLKVVVEAL